MQLRVIINALIILFISHILLQNVDCNIDLGKQTTNNSVNTSNGSLDKTLNFLLDDKVENFTTQANASSEDIFRSKLLHYVNNSHKDVAEKATDLGCQTSTVGAYNNNTEYNSTPNFNSNTADISKFFKTTYDNLSEQQLVSDDSKKLVPSTSVIDQQSKMPGFTDSNNNTGDKTFSQQTWQYKNELPMNGGSLQDSSIVGFDTLGSNYAVFDKSSLNLQSCSDKSPHNINVDDLRKGNKGIKTI